MPAQGSVVELETSSADVIVVGGGPIGLAVAWRTAQAGLSVIVVDPDPDRGAWRTAAGMLAPITELHYAESDLLRLNLASASRYPAFVEELTALTGLPTGYRDSGTVEVAWDSADLAALRDLHAFGTGLGLTSTMLSASDLRHLEPGLAAGLPGGLHAEHDHQVDPRLLHAALTAATTAAGVRHVRARATVSVTSDRVRAVQLDDGSLLATGQVVLAAGAWSTQPELGVADLPAVRPVKGQTIRLRTDLGSRHVVRATVKGSPVYVVPRENGEVVVGASSEEAGFDVRPRAGAVYELLRDAQSVLPVLAEAELTEVCTGLRPGSPDNAPLLGSFGPDGLILATGHYRNGILLAPVTADGIAAVLSGAGAPAEIAPFNPSRLAVTA